LRGVPTETAKKNPIHIGAGKGEHREGRGGVLGLPTGGDFVIQDAILLARGNMGGGVGELWEKRLNGSSGLNA